MLRLKTILKIYLLILIGGFWFAAPLHAQNMEGINFPQKRFEISFGGGWGLYRMTNINKHYIDEIGIFDDHIDNGPTVLGEVGYFVSPYYSVNLGISYLHTGITKKINGLIMDEQGNVVGTYPEKYSLSASLIVPELKIKYHFPQKKLGWFFSGGTAWCFGKSVLKAESSLPQGMFSKKYRFTAQGLGFLASTGVSYNLNKMISFGTEIGYRLLATGDLKDKDSKVWIVDATGRSHRMNLDFSGSFMLGSLSIRL
jgi:hypothetical protein